MLLAVWIGLAAALVAVAWGGTLVVLRGLRTWRASRRLMRNLSTGLGDLERSAAATTEKAAKAGAGSERLAEALERLQHSLAELAVLRAAATEARALPRSVFAFIPRK